MKRVLILGGGFGGVAAAHTLRRRLAEEDEIVVVDQQSHFTTGFRKTWVMLGYSAPQEGQRPLVALERSGIRFKQATITAIEPANHRALIDGQWIEADALIVALGARLAPEMIPGLKEYALNVYDPSQALSNGEALRAFSGGRVVIGIFGLPYKCPPAPYEISLLTEEFFRQRGLPVEMEVFSPQPMSLPIIGEAGCNVLEGRLAEHGIGFLPNRKASAVEQGEVIFEGGEERPFDLLIGVPPHRCPDVLVEGGLTGADGWVSVNRYTFETPFPDVYAAGDCVQIPLPGGKQLPKAGIMAEMQVTVAAERIATRFAGQEPTAVFDGKGYCFLEVGRGEAAYVQGEFYAEPGPMATLTEPSAANLEHKRAWEAERLRAWFGD